ncbi:NAD-dependent epimerase/dehydratase family protein [Hyphococcus flavus]|uniref:NAD-dependent epimerase/dehydratase family protein n=1 Tax=Hyphococcus flavus TaxID=1866326 RepID=A0AAF0CHC4_9PROT|nr:NAD-dependent epimerase/dehydratase family protein [Hyphococcus flavus]WDI31737.1 NAD-dependent epimerase/dehydratase family protein [Hyphococcus flavus]
MKALITGIAGFIGFHTAKRLAKSGWNVIGVDNLNDYYDPALKRARLAVLDGQIAFHELDIAAAVAFAKLVETEKPDVVIHLAAQAGVRYSIDNPFAYARSNLLGHLSVLEACRHADHLSHLIYASSSSVYGGNTKTPFSETDPVDAPVSLYAATKKSDELMSSTYAHLYGIKQIGLRFFTVYGPWGRPDMAYWTFTQKMIKGEPIPVFNHGKMRRDFTFIDDVVDRVAAIADKPPVFSKHERPHKIYNIGNHTPVPLLDFISALENATGCKAKKDMQDMQPGDVIETFADVSRLSEDYGFNPSTPIESGLKTFVEWYRSYHGI